MKPLRKDLAQQADNLKTKQDEIADTQFIVMSALADMYDDIMAEIASIKTQITPK